MTVSKGLRSRFASQTLNLKPPKIDTYRSIFARSEGFRQLLSLAPGDSSILKLFYATLLMATAHIQ